MAANSASSAIPAPAAGFKALVALVAIGVAAAVYRFSVGLGASTNLSDNVPWGLWVAVDVLSGVALAAGGFSITAAVYIFNMKKYKPIARPAILTAFIGYLVVVMGLVVDIGKPLDFWHPIFMWNYRSVMFEVVWCITLYLSVLALEFAPAFLERFQLHGLLKVLKFFTYPLVIAGIVLSFLHQSSLGGFFLIMPHKTPAMWYTPNMPYMFYLSAIAVGLAMVSFESIVSARSFKREPEMDIIEGLGRGAMITLIIYLAAKFGDLAYRGNLPAVFSSGKASLFFILEITIGVLLPIILYANKAVRQSANGMLLASSCVIVGTVMNRFNINFFSQAGPKAHYFPSITELLVTVGLVALMVLLYRLAVTYLPVFHEPGKQH
ncbi:MAG TPA: Ni/Fe-hydrogenase cytochrome b subunit [Nitrospirota bacterium]|nr:Ni/Fe-hydrogenase cytochrome b subunit [Nitrospirota bacterium]